MYTNSGIRLYRGLVVHASQSSGDVFVKVPELLGDKEYLTVTKDFLYSDQGGWDVPNEGSQVLVGIEGERARNVYLVSSIKQTSLTTGLLNNPILKSAEERWNVVSAAATGTVDLNTMSSSAWLYTLDALGNWTLNVRGSETITLASLLNINDSITVAFAATQGAIPYYQTGFEIDGNAVTPKWQGSSSPSSGTANGIDVYVFTIIKTASSSFSVLASKTPFA